MKNIVHTIFTQAVSLILLFIISILPSITQAQKAVVALWNDVPAAALKDESSARLIVPNKARTLRLDITSMKSLLANAPAEPVLGTSTEGLEISLPTPDGNFKRYKVWYSPIMAPELAAQYPEIRTYGGYEIGNGASLIRLDVTPKGFHAMTYGDGASIFIDPYAVGNTQDYLAYYKRDFVKKEAERMTCHVNGEEITIPKPARGQQESVGDCGIRHEYRLALAGTGEYTTFHGGTVALALAAMNTTMNRVNGVFEKDVAVRMIIVANNNLIIYTDATTDPFTNGTPNLMIGENQTNCDAVIGNGNYDIGHVFGTNSGGLASLGAVCSNSFKARGVTGSGAPIGDPFDIDYVAHEIGHQFDANHTQYNNCQRNNATAIEPGSASTIMGYAGICSPNVQLNSDDYFSTASLFEMRPFVATGGGRTCDVAVVVSNSAPSVTALANYSIPASTPFVLTASATDPNGVLTYCWEQIDAYVAPIQTMPPAATNTTGPMFRSLDPVSSPSRYFPNLPNLFNNVNPTWEELPSVARNMNFRVTVRDNFATAGCTGEASNTVTTVASTGPFAVTSPNTAVTYNGGSTQTVTWDVAGTTAAPISCANVDILLTTDGGATFTTLLANTPNDGTQSVTMPNITTTTARVWIQCSDNIFFDVSNVNFTINMVSCTSPSFTACPAAPVTANTATGLCTTAVTYTVTADGTPSPTLTYAFTGATPGGGSGTGSGSNFNKGNTIVTVTATNACGTPTCVFTVTVSDNIPPTITCPNNVAVNTATNSCANTATWIAPVGTDNCTGASTMGSHAPGASFNKGQTTVTYTVTDGANLTSSCSFLVIVTDNQPPAITCPGNVAVNTATNSCANTATWTAPVGTDNCTGASTMGSHAPGASFNKGQTTVTYTVTDGANLTSSCSFLVIVTDNQTPAITCPSNVAVNTATNSCANTATWIAPVGTDNCTGASTMGSHAPGASFNKGQTTVTYTVTDGSNLTSSCSFLVIVTDNQPPAITCPGNVAVNTATNSCANTATWIAPVGTDNCTGASTMGSHAPGASFNKGQTTVTYTVTDGSNLTSSCSFLVIVTDNQPPAITCPGNVAVNTATNSCANTATWIAPVGTDNCTGASTMGSHAPGASFNKGQTTVTYTVTDGANLTSSCSFLVIVTDNQPPAITCPDNIIRPTDLNLCSAVVTYATPIYSDNCSGGGAGHISGGISGSTFLKGTTTVNWQATDGVGLTKTCSFTITVTDGQAPTITCPANIIRPTDPNLCSAVVHYTTPIYSDNCAGGSAIPNSNGITSGSTFQKGITTVLWQATDGVGLTKTCSFTITVTDVQAPTIICPANIVRSTNAGQCSASSVAYATPTVSDNCSLPATPLQWVSGGTMPTASGANSVSNFQKGINIVTWRATDGAGLTRTCTFRVTVNDTEAPTLTCPAAMNLVTATTTCSAVATYTNPTFTDNCTPTSGTATRISGLVSGSTFPVGNSNVVFQATDAAGNTRRCTMVVTVTDNQPPVITCPTPVVVNGSGLPCTAIVFYGNTTASDNCAGTLTPFLVSGLANGSVFPAGVTTNTFRAVAPNGQSSECSFSVTVNCGSGLGNNGVEVRDADLSIQHSNKLELKLAPNPALSTVTVSIAGVGAGGGTLLVFDAVGRQVLRQVIAENQQTAVFQVDGSAFVSSMYRVSLRTEHGMVTKTLVVVK